jgi:mono/diheme cytochrome c family protein
MHRQPAIWNAMRNSGSEESPAMTILTKIIAATALTGIVFVNGAGALKAADSSSVLTMKEMQGVSFDIGTQRAVSYFLNSSGTCRLVLTMAEPYNGSDDGDDVYSFASSRFETAIPAGRAARFKPASGRAFEFTCQAGAKSMSITAVELEQQEYAVLPCSTALCAGAAARENAPAGKFYRVVDGKVDARTYNGFRRYHGGCNHCHGQDGMGSTFGRSLVEGLPDIEHFRRIVRDGASSGSSVMKGYTDDPNVAPYVDDIYAYLQARADGALGRGRPIKVEQ